MEKSLVEQELHNKIKRLEQENKRLHQQLHEGKADFEIFMDNSPATAFFKDEKGELMYINESFIDAFGFADRDWHRKTDFELWDKDTAKVLRENDLRILNSGRSEAVEEDVLQADGMHHWLTHKFCFSDAYGNKYIGGMGVDLTEQKLNDRKLEKAREKAEAASRDKSEFLSLISHELRTPLHSILSSSELWLDSDSEFDQQELINYINLAARRLRSQVENLVLLAETDNKELEAGNFEFETRPLIERISSYAKGLLNDNVEFTLEYANSIPSRFVGDAYLVEHMIRTVLENACKYTGQGFVSLGVDWDDERDMLDFIICDSGQGISQEQRKKMYNDAVTVSRGLNRASEGMGLGLTICYRLSEILSADLMINSEAGSGTQFTINVPLETRVSHLASLDSSVNDSFNVLVVEDNIINATVLEKIIRKFGHKVTIAHSGNEALTLLSDQVYDLIMMDIQMPIMDGITATRWIRQRGINTPIIAVTCNSELEVRQRCMQSGMNDFLIKPASQSDILRVLERHKSNKR